MRRALPVAVYTVAWLVLLDVGLGLATHLPEDPRVEPSALQRYFDYGRSVEGKLRYMVRATRQASAPVSTAGWIDPRNAVDPKTEPSTPDRVLVAAYGQSFTGQMLQALSVTDPHFEVRLLGGPGAPLSHSFAMYRMDRGRHRARVVVLGLLASALPQLTSLTNMTAAFEAPQPCSYPRFVLRGRKLQAIESSVRSFDELQAVLAEPQRFARFVDELERHDAAYDGLVFEQDWLDASSLGRVIRRGYGQKRAREFRAHFLDQVGFTNHGQVLDVAEAILAAFAVEARRDGQLPFVLLINDRGFADHLHRALAPRLERLGVPYFSTHERAPATRAGLFLKDGHFTPEVNAALATDLGVALRAELGRRSTAP